MRYPSPGPRFRLLSGVTLLALLLGTLLADPGLLQPEPAYAATIGVGLGSYTSDLPAGRQVPSNSDGVAVAPKRTANVHGAMPTNDWWSSLAWQRYAGNPYSENMFAHPLAFHAKAGGLAVSYPTNPNVSSGNPSYLQEFHYGFPEDLTLGVAGLNSPDAKVDGYSDWTVTAYWSDGARALRATFGHGLPFVYATRSGGDALINFVATPTIWFNSGNVIGATVNGHHYAVFAPGGATWNISGTTLRSTLAGKDYFSLAVLPDTSSTTLSLFQKYAYSFVTDTRVSWSYDAARATLTTTFNVVTSAKEGSQSGTLMALYRHQWLNTPDSLTGYTYVSPRGQMRLREGSSFRTSLTFNGVLPALPDQGTYDRTRLYNYVNEFYTSGNYFPAGWTGTYWQGKAFGRLAALVRIAEQVGHTAARDAFLNAMKDRLQNWLTASPGEASNLFYYNNTWGTLIGYPAEFGSDTELNDHHFHYGYFIMAAATIAQYDPGWASDSNWGGMVKLLIKDAANWDSADTRFPRLRHFDPYAGHSWASGHAGFGAGNNQESSSEAINFATAVILWGSATGDTSVRDLGIFLYTNEVAAIEQYWFDVNDAVFPSGFNRSTVGIVWGDGGAYATWWTANPEEIHGINFLPITGGSLYLGRNPGYIPNNYNDMRANNGGDETEWRDIIWSFYGFYDAGAAVSKFNNNSGYAPEDGETKAHTYHWLHNLNAMGRLDTSVTANIPTYAVFNKNGTRTYVAYNPGSSSITVSFSDGFSLSVPARSLAARSGDGTQPPDGSGSGLTGEYFNNSDFTNRALTRTDATVDFDWGSGSPDPSVGADTFSVRWTGQVQPRYSETYTFYTISDDGVRLWVNGQQIINNWTDHGPTEDSGSITLQAGQQYDIRMEFYENGGGAVAKLSWSSPSQPKEIIPQTQLYPAGDSSSPKSNTLYVIDGAALGTASALAFSEGGGASTDTIPSAGGQNYDGTPHNPLVYVVSNVSGSYDSTKSTQFNLYLDAGATVGNGVQARISYDFSGDGSYDRIETYNYFATNDLSGWERYSQAQGLKSASGTFANLNNGRIRLELWCAIGSHDVFLRTSATSDEQQQSTLSIPFTNIQ